MLQVQFSRNRLASAGNDGREGKTKSEEYSMNKLVITASLLVAVASSYAAEPLILEEDVYSVVINMKTTKPNVTYISGNEFVYRSVTSKTLNGFMCLPAGAPLDEVNAIIIGYNGEPLMSSDIWNSVVRIGKNNDGIEADGAIWGGDVAIFMRGFGTYDIKNNRVSSIEGSINAFLPAPELNGEPVFGYVLDAPFIVPYIVVPDTNDNYITEQPATIAFGTFSIKYSLEASKKEALLHTPDGEAAYNWFIRKLGITLMP
jgi:hypothetical protein